MSRSLLCCAVLLALSASPARAEDATDLDRVTVSASTSRLPDSEAALPNTITVIDREQLERQLTLTQDLSQVLANLIPAFAPSSQKLTSRGESLRGRQPLYMVDGVPQSTPLRDGARDSRTIDPAMIERIEVVHGANALQGLGASGGIINIITKRAPRQDGATFVDVAVAGSTALPSQDEGTSVRGSVLFGTRRGAFDLIAGASIAEEGLYYDGDGRAIAVNGVQGDTMDAHSRNLFAKVGWRLDDERRLQLTANHFELQGHNDYVSVDGDAVRGITATSVRGEPEGEGPRNRADSLSLDYTDNAFAGGYLQAQLYWFDFAALYGGSYWRDFFQDGSRPNWFDQSQNASRKLGAKFAWSRDHIADLPLRVMLGLDAQRDTTYQELIESGLNWVPETTYESVAPFVQAEYRLGPVALIGGVRHERAELQVDDFTTLPIYGSQRVEGGSPRTRETLGNLGAIWNVNDAFKLYASYAEGYTVADIGRVLRAISRPGERVDTLADIRPVIADNREVGLDYDDGRWLVHVAAYWSDAEFGSRLDYNPDSRSYEVRREPTKIRGVEANAALQVSEATRVGIAYAAAEGRYDGIPERNPDGWYESDLSGADIAPDRATGFWEQQWTTNVSTRLQASHAFDRGFESEGQEVATFDGYTTFDLQARIALPVGHLNVGVENLFDRQYVTYYSQTTPSNRDYVSGRGRVLTLGWSNRF
ncbi:TonB-dependent receptor [Cognatilysobacter bugurensis]|uniref:TonB-dependent receptor n=1 Tax=Cognatilysobacter bugurensis TaxID=543356 RepID=A0A918WB83_9GAMM|nr:TonB-dependent receptor [Lysobacter bugurensis]GHA89000.1 TonB-dependent receptor [Lysobacter bugurensis]